MIDIKDRICDAVAGKVMSAEAATDFIHNGDNLGVSGFTRLAIRKLYLLPCLKDTKAPISKLTFGPALL